MIEDDETVEPIDIAAAIDQMRASGRVPPEALVAIERAHEIFKRHAALEPEIARQAFEFGPIIGAHDAGAAAVAEAQRLRQSVTAYRSARARKNPAWHEPARQLWQVIRDEYPSITQDAVVAEIKERWGKKAKAAVKYPNKANKKNKDRTLLELVRTLDATRKLPQSKIEVS